MLRLLKFNIPLYGFLILVIPFFVPEKIIAQEIVGSGIWVSSELKYSATKKLDFNFNQQIREIISPIQIGTLQLEAGIDYSVLKHLSVSAYYRFDVKPDIYLPDVIQHRIYFDLDVDHKFKKKFTVDFRLRFQKQFQIIKLPSKYLRPKLTFKYKLNKKYSVYTDGELFYNISYLGNQFDDCRWETGVTWDWKHGMSWKASYMLAKSFNVAPPGYQHIFGITFGKDW
ncbi:MAG: DUF2490 domain-containing protein [Bacteroidota bacterium]